MCRAGSPCDDGIQALDILRTSQKEWRFWLLEIVFDRSSYLKILCKL